MDIFHVVFISLKVPSTFWKKVLAAVSTAQLLRMRSLPVLVKPFAAPMLPTISDLLNKVAVREAFWLSFTSYPYENGILCLTMYSEVQRLRDFAPAAIWSQEGDSHNLFQRNMNLTLFFDLSWKVPSETLLTRLTLFKAASMYWSRSLIFLSVASIRSRIPSTLPRPPNSTSLTTFIICSANDDGKMH